VALSSNLQVNMTALGGVNFSNLPRGYRSGGGGGGGGGGGQQFATMGIDRQLNPSVQSYGNAATRLNAQRRRVFNQQMIEQRRQDAEVKRQNAAVASEQKRQMQAQINLQRQQDAEVKRLAAAAEREQKRQAQVQAAAQKQEETNLRGQLTFRKTALKAQQKAADEAYKNSFAGKLDRANTKLANFGFGIIEYKALQAMTDAVGAFFDEINRAVDAAAKMDRFRQSFNNLLGSKLGPGALNQVQQFAQGTPFSLDDSITLAQRFIAVGFQWQQVIPIMTAAGNSVARLGKGNDDLDRLVLALTQIQSKGKLMGQEMRQMSEVGVDALSILSASLGKTTAQVQELVTKGEISNTTFFEAFKKWDAANGDFLKQQSQDYIGVQQNLDDVRFQIEATFGDALMRGRTKSMQALVDTLKNPAVLQSFKQWGSALGAVAGGFMDFIKNAIQGIILVQFELGKLTGRISGETSFAEYVHNLAQAWTDAQGAIDSATAAINNQSAALERQKQAYQDKIDALTAQNDLMQEAVSLEDKLAGLAEDQFNINRAQRLSLSDYTSEGRAAAQSLPGLYEAQARDLRHFAVDQQIAANNATIKIYQANIDAGVLTLSPKMSSTQPGYGTTVPLPQAYAMGGSIGPSEQSNSTYWLNAMFGGAMAPPGGGYLLGNGAGATPQGQSVGARRYVTGGGFYNGGRASGGSVSGGWYTVGEHGPELLHAGGSGSVVANGGMTVTHRCPDCQTDWLVEQASNPRVKRAYGAAY
jgi:tape measure domain-containing protein